MTRYPVLAAMLLWGSVSASLAQTYPVRPVTMIVPSAAGGPSDVLARLLAPSLTKQLGQPLIIENIGGAGGNIGVTRTARAAADGYTLLMQNIGMALGPALYRNLDYDPLNDFEYVGLVSWGSMALIGRPSLPVKDFSDFLAYVKANRQSLSFANSGLGGPSHLCGLLFMSAISTALTTVPYRGTAPAMNDLVGGRVDLSCDSVSTAAPQIRSGKVRAFGVTSRTRAMLLPDVPTLEEQGLRGFEMTTWQAMYAPKGTPKFVIDRVVSALQNTLRDRDLAATLVQKLGIDPVPAESATPAALHAHLKSELERWGPLIRKAGIHAE